MNYWRCKCGKAKSWESGMPPHDCNGCDECGTTLAMNPQDHKPLVPHDWKPYFLGGSTPREVRQCARCGEIDRGER